MTHAILSASAAHRWSRCHGSIAAEMDYPESTSIHAALGTAAHEVAAKVLTNNLPSANSLKGEIIKVDGFEFEVDTEMVVNVDKYVNDIRDRIEELKLLYDEVKMLVETKVNYSEWLGVAYNKAFGTADVILIAYSKDDFHVEVHDLKYGKGEVVEAEDSDQLRPYALGTLTKIGEEFKTFKNEPTFVLGIHQPRLNYAPEVEISYDELIKFANDISMPAKLALVAIEKRANGEDYSNMLTVGDKQCRWCKAKANCKAYNKEVATIVFNDFEAFEEPPKNLEPIMPKNNSHLSIAYGKLKLIRQWCDAIEKEMFKQLAEGTTGLGYKLVQGRAGNRRWGDISKAEEYLKQLLGEDAYTRDLISPANVSKIYDKDSDVMQIVESLVTRPEGKVVIAAESDKRESVSIESDNFDDFE